MAAREAPPSTDTEAGRPTRRRRWAQRYAARRSGEERLGGGGGAGAWLARAMRAVANLVRLIAFVVAAIIALGILLVVLEANPDNSIVSAIDDAARWLVGPFDDMFNLDDAKAAVAVNWGIAAVVYLIAGALVARLIEAIGTLGLRTPRRRLRA